MVPRTEDLRVLVVADDPLARAGLAALLSGQPGCEVVGRVTGQADLPQEVKVYQPEVILWDLGWDPNTTLEHLADLRDEGIPIVALLPHQAHANKAWATGARGLLLRSASGPALAATLRAAAAGLSVLDPELSTVLSQAGDRAPTPLLEDLTPRELEVLRLLAQGLPNKSIAQRLDISEHTVKFHINAIMSKLGAQSRTEAVVLATRLGLVTL